MLNFKTMYLVLGNHDKTIRQALLKGMLNDYIESGKLIVFGGRDAIEDHTLSTSKMLDIEGQKVFISHYPSASWPNVFRNSIMLHSHCHGRLEKKFRRMDVGVDTFSETHKRFFPWPWEEIKIEMEKVKVEFKEKE